MADRFDKFTDRARRVLTHAQHEAQSLNHNYIGTEHLLLGLLDEQDGLAYKALVDLGVAPDELREAVLAAAGRGNVSVSGEIGLTPRSKKVIELSVDEARRMNHHYVGTEHLLLGLLREEQSIAAGVLQGRGVTLERAQAAVLARLRQVPPRPVASVGERLKDLVPWWQPEKTNKRYSLVLPESLFDQVQALADREQTTVVDVMRRFIKLGLLATEIQATPGSALIIREGGKERELLIL
jgi:ATP-dependent Clp protease ATP-binding subunit ClpA